nr:Vam6/Vps39-like protein [Tanacetum cinerariifolium]
YAHHLFGNGRYEDAMEHFVASQVELTHVLALYPSIVLPKSLISAEAENIDIAGESYLSRGSSVASDDMDSSPTSLPEFDETYLVNSYLKQHGPSMQATYLELMLSMNEDGVSQNLQNEMLQIYLSEVLDWYADLNAKKEWDEKNYTTTRKKLMSALQSVTSTNLHCPYMYISQYWLAGQ